MQTFLWGRWKASCISVASRRPLRTVSGFCSVILTQLCSHGCLLQVLQRSRWNATSLSLSLWVCIALSLLAVGSSAIGSPADTGSIELSGDDAPVETTDKTPSELSNSGSCGSAGCEIEFTSGAASQAVVRSDRIRSDAFIEQVIQNAKLPDMTESYDMITPLRSDAGDRIYMLVNEGMPYVLKLYNSGITRQYAEFHQVLLKRASDAEAKAHPGCAAVCHAAMPVGWATHMGKKGLVFRYVVPPRQPRKPTANDRAQVRDQLAFLHWLGYVHLDITDRNIMLAEDEMCFLIDFDSVCKIGHVPLGPLPNECTEELLTRRFPARLDDDDHLWQHLQTTFFKDLSADEVTQAPVEVKQQQAPGEVLVH